MILLETLDPGRKQVVYEDFFTVHRLCENINAWDTASKNTPTVEIRIRDKKEFTLIGPICPCPDDICRLFKLNYTRSGFGKPMNQSAVSLHDIYRLYMPNLQTDRSRLSEQFLRLAVQKSLWLIGDASHQIIANYALPKQSQTQARQAAMFASLLSILLYLSGIGKENYMSDAPFNVGQFLKLSDMLHKEYCIKVRNKDKNTSLPSQLMGNEMLAIAAENPIEGLNRLRERMRIYLAWADTAVGENIGLVKWILTCLGEVSKKIASASDELPAQFSPAEQAQVLLGYLATIEHEKKEQVASNKPDTNEQRAKEDNSNG
jgi:hypothetical protein